MRVLVFGASITQGFWDTKGGWVQRLRSYYDELQVQDFGKDQPTIFNLGISADTTKGVLDRFESETKARKNQDVAFVFSIGTNNAIVEGNGKEWSNPEEYKKELEALIQNAQKYSSKIMFVGLPCCDEAKTTPVFWQDIHYTNERLLQFEEIMRKVCKEQNIPHVPTFEALKEKQESGQNMFADGLHPNNEGHELIYELVRPELDKLLSV